MNPKKKNIRVPNLFLIGFMGTGKSSAGKCAAKKLKMEFLDSDQQVEATYGSSIRIIFENEGEAKFRELEKKFIHSGCPKTNCLISCGGGLPIPNGMIELLKSKGLVFSLDASVDTILERTSDNNSRPLLQAENPKDAIQSLLKKRKSKYLLADQVISTEERNTEQVADEIVQAYIRSIS